MPARHAPRTKLDGIFRAHLRSNSPICIVRQIGISHSPEQESGDNMETVEISSSSDFRMGNRAGAGNLNVRRSCICCGRPRYGRGGAGEHCSRARQAISDAMLEVFDGLIGE